MASHGNSRGSNQTRCLSTPWPRVCSHFKTSASGTQPHGLLRYDRLSTSSVGGGCRNRRYPIGSRDGPPFFDRGQRLERKREIVFFRFHVAKAQGWAFVTPSRGESRGEGGSTNGTRFQSQIHKAFPQIKAEWRRLGLHAVIPAGTPESAGARDGRLQEPPRLTSGAGAHFLFEVSPNPIQIMCIPFSRTPRVVLPFCVARTFCLSSRRDLHAQLLT